jgi:hypothetical protein
MGSVKAQNLLDQTTTDGGGAATDSGDAVTNPKNSPKTGLYSFFDVWHYEGSRRSY